MSSTNIVISVEAGEWPPESILKDVADRAIEAATAALRKEKLSYPSPNPSLHPASRRLRRTRGGEESRELSIVFTDDAGMRKLNAKWRGKDKPTNVLSFPQNQRPLLGDVILAAETVAKEAALADKPLEDHMAHLIIHGFLHLLGFDHEAGDDAEKMEQLERVALKKLGIDDPYAAAS